MMILRRRCRVILFAVFFIVHIVTVFGSPPLINPDARAITVDTGSTLVIRCSGISDLLWKPASSQTHLKMSQYSTKNPTTKIYEVTLKIPTVIYTHTGNFSCSYKNVTRGSLGFTSSIYVFVRDAVHLLVPMKDNSLQIFFNRKNIIPCRPTNPEVKVTLKKRNKTVYMSSKDIVFDNQVGFEILYPNVFFNGAFTCEASLDGKQNVASVILNWNEINEETNIPLPKIYLNGYSLTAIGEKFTFSCLINIPSQSNKYSLTWDYPNKENTRVIQGPLTSTNRTSINRVLGPISFIEIVRNITVDKADFTNEGIYSCIISSHQTTRVQIRSTYVTIRENDHAALRLKADFHNTIQEYKFGQKANFTIHVEAFEHGDLKLVWYKDFKIFDCVRQYTCEIKRYANGTTSMNFLKFDFTDTANYTFIAKSGNKQKSVNFSLLIIGKPNVSVTPKVVNHIADKIYEITCSVYAVPKAKISWVWRSCENEDCSDVRRNLPLTSDSPNRERIRETFDGWYVRSFLKLTARQTGYYTCVAENDLGKSEDDHLFIVTDAVNNSAPIGFGFVKFNRSPFQNDRVEIECRVSKYNFTFGSLALKFLRDSDSSQPFLTLENKKGLTITTTESKYTYGIRATFDSIKETDNGSYVCEASSPRKNRKETCTMKVLPTTPLKVVKTNMDGSVYSIERERGFRFVCNVSSVPLPNIIWAKNNEIIDAVIQTQFTFVNDLILEISRIVVDDAGTYSCQATSRGQSITLNATLLVIVLSSGESFSLTHGLVITFIALVTITVVILIAIFVRKCRVRKKQKIYTFDTEKYQKGAVEQYNPELPLEEQIDTLPYDRRWEFPRNKLKLKKTIGIGAFGKVVLADANGISSNETSTTVAVKMLKDHANTEQRKAIMQELKIMTHLGRHVNILNLLGACVLDSEDGQLYIIMEHCRYGCLRKYLLRTRDRFVNQINPETGEIDVELLNAMNGRKQNLSPPPVYKTVGEGGYLVPYAQTLPHSSNRVNKARAVNGVCGRVSRAIAVKNPLTTCDLMGFAFQIARGMEYLESRNIIHRDLALRNVLLAKNKIVKICDFGLTKDCYDKAYYRKKGDGSLPVKWLAAECIRDRVFTVKSDVWSFGIVLWELFSLGGDPYPGLDIDEHFLKRILGGYRMEKPEFGTDELYRIMRECWHNDPTQRPSFSCLSDWIGDQLQSGLRKHYIRLNAEFLKSHTPTASNMDNPDYIEMANQIPNYSNENHRISEISTTESENGYLTMAGLHKLNSKRCTKEVDKNELKPMLSDENCDKDKIIIEVCTKSSTSF